MFIALGNSYKLKLVLKFKFFYRYSKKFKFKAKNELEIALKSFGGFVDKKTPKTRYSFSKIEKDANLATLATALKVCNTGGAKRRSSAPIILNSGVRPVTVLGSCCLG